VAWYIFNVRGVALHSPRRRDGELRALLRIATTAALLVVLASGVGCATGGGTGDRRPADAGVRDAARGDGAVGTDAAMRDAGSTDAGPPRTCMTDPDCDDGLVCNGTQTCAMGTCAVAMPGPTCDDAVDCTNDSCAEPSGTCNRVPDDSRCTPGKICDPARGCVDPAPCATDAECDDGNFCNGAETCDPASGCRSGAAPMCDDGLSCTSDGCDAAMGTSGACVHTPRDMGCADGLACNGVERCMPGAAGADPATGCTPGTRVTCDDGVACTTDVCNEPGGTCTSSGADADGDGFQAVGCMGGADCDDTSAAVHPGAAEICDGRDNDCSGGVDDGAGMTCALGSGAVSCSTSCGTPGTQSCDAACHRTACTAAVESCNGCDDNGNGVADEGFLCRQSASEACSTACGTPGTRACNASCSGYTSCSGAEVCNGCDDNANGVADDGFACRQSATTPCTTACGTAGTQTCNASCTALSTCAAASETCGNGCDDNANGLVDEGCGGGAPGNDTCGGATPLSASGTRADTLVGATAQVSDCGSGVDVFYSVTVGQRSLVYLDTFGTTAFDTRISYRGTSCPGASAQCIDDSCGTLQTQLVQLVAAGTHYFGLHTYSSFTTPGAFQLNFQIVPAANGLNSVLGAAGTYSGTTAGASNVSATCGGSAASPEDCYYWMQCPAQTRTVTADTCTGSSFDTVLHSVGPTGALACNDDSCGLQSSLTFTATGAGLFQLFLDGYSAFSSGTYGMNVTAF